jgi:hypothetical protein
MKDSFLAFLRDFKEREKKQKRNLRLLSSGPVNLAILAREIADFARLRLGAVAGRLGAADERVEVGARVGAGAVDRDGLEVDVVAFLRGEEQGRQWSANNGSMVV